MPEAIHQLRHIGQVAVVRQQDPRMTGLERLGVLLGRMVPAVGYRTCAMPTNPAFLESARVQTVETMPRFFVRYQRFPSKMAIPAHLVRDVDELVPTQFSTTESLPMSPTIPHMPAL